TLDREARDTNAACVMQAFRRQRGESKGMRGPPKCTHRAKSSHRHPDWVRGPAGVTPLWRFWPFCWLQGNDKWPPMGAQWKQKGREQGAEAKGRLFTKLAKEIMVAARAGADPNTNSRLRFAIEQAKRNSMTRDTVERAIKKGAGLLDDSSQFETVVYEGFAPYQVPVIVECLTDNKNRTAPNMRQLFRKGQLGASGSVSWDFKRRGAVEATPPDGMCDVEEAALLAGAQDVEPAD